MGRLKGIALAGAVSLLPGLAFAADMAHPPLYSKAPVIVDDVGSGWYLRGDIGVGVMDVGNIHNNIWQNDPTFTVLDIGMDDTWFVGAGLGYKFNSWFRMDATGEYRGSANFHGLDRYSGSGGGANEYHGSFSSSVFLMNAYLDLGTWCCVTPYVGAGIGMAYNRFGNVRDINTPNNAVAFAKYDSTWELAWALYAGVAYKVTPGFTVELGYRYLNLGDAKSGDTIAFGGGNTIYNPLELKDIESHDIKLAMRWQLGGCPECAPPPPPPLVRKY